MIGNRHITAICCVMLALALVFTCVFVSGLFPAASVAVNADTAQFGYVDTLFNTSYVHSLNISVDDEKWQEMLDNAMAEEYISCDVTIDGTTLKNVAIRPKGNTSLSNVQSKDSDRYSFKIKFNKYDEDTTYKGLDKLALNNIIQDNTYMKDYFSYRMMAEAGAEAPLCSFIYIKVNNEDRGLYLAVEAIDEAFAERNYGSDHGEIYKPESMAMGGGMGRRENGDKPPEMPGGGFGGGMPPMPDFETNTEAAERPANMGGPGGRPGGNNTVALIYQDDNPDSYSAIFDYSAFDIDEADKKRLISSLKQLNESENLEEVVDVDEVLRYFAAHNFTVNSDSYTGNLMHNYYLHEKDGKMSMIAWDYNLAFGGMGGGPGGRANRGGESATDSATKYVNYPIDTPMLGASMDERPMIGKLFENEEYMAHYHEVFDEFITGYFESGDFENEYNRVFNMIAEYVQKDPTKFCTFDEFVTAAGNLKQFCLLRAESVRGQLDGTIPSTDEGQSADSSMLIDASSVDIDSMGDMGMGGGPGGMDHEGAPKDENAADAETGSAHENPPEDMTENGNTPPDGGRGNGMFDTSRLAGMLGMDETELEAMSEDEIRTLIEEKINAGELNMSPRGDSILRQSRTESYALFGASLLLLLIGIVFAFIYKRRRI